LVHNADFTALPFALHLFFVCVSFTFRYAIPWLSSYPASTTLLAQSLRLFSQRPDKEWGLTDCSSFVIMQQKGLYAALTADHHFEQAGFLPLLRTNNS
jgi:predicted nucleic acid-binding protein